MSEDISDYTGICDCCGHQFHPEDLWQFNHRELGLHEQWCSACYIPYLQDELVASDGLAVRYAEVAMSLANMIEREGNRPGVEMSHDARRVLRLCRDIVTETPERQANLMSLVALLVAVQNYGYGAQLEMAEKQGWEPSKTGEGLIKETVEGPMAAPNATLALQREIMNYTRVIIGEQLYDAVRKSEERERDTL